MKSILPVLAFTAVALGSAASAAEPKVDCLAVFNSVSAEVKKDTSKTLEVVDAYSKANPSCACEIVKAAIKASNADSKTVGAIVETAGLAAPQSLEIISQCAQEAAPDAKKEIAKAVAVVEAGSPSGPGNPLDFPGSGVDAIGGDQVGDNPASPGGLTIIPPGTLPNSGSVPPANPPVITPGPVTPTTPAP